MFFNGKLSQKDWGFQKPQSFLMHLTDVVYDEPITTLSRQQPMREYHDSFQIMQIQVISATAANSTTVDFWVKSREKSFGQMAKLGRPGG